MEKQSYLKPFMVIEKFLPQEFVALCDVPDTTYYKVDIKAVETDNIEGWSDGDNTTITGVISIRQYRRMV